MFGGLNEIVQELLDAKPFVSFEIWMRGEGIVVSAPEHARVQGEDFNVLVVYEPGRDRTAFINLDAVDQIRVRGNRLNI